MMSFFIELNPICQAVIATTITFILTALGSASIFLFKKINDIFLNKLLSLSAGIMLASSIFSLLIPSINSSESLKISPALLCSIGIILGTSLLFVGDKLHKNSSSVKNLILSITLHNIPEGMAIGVAFAGAACTGLNSVMGAVTLAIGIGIQNFPEGSAISFPLFKEGYSKKRAFLIGAGTAIVEPLGAILGVILTLKMQFIFPLLLAFAAGAMLYVIVVELIPESMANKNKELMALYLILGFIIMMVLDISIG